MIGLDQSWEDPQVEDGTHTFDGIRMDEWPLLLELQESEVYGLGLLREKELCNTARLESQRSEKEMEC